MPRPACSSGVPAGPLGGHGDHKLARIETLLSTYPELNFLLIGDSGEEDPELYARVVRDHPGRVLAVYIRDVVHTPGVDARVCDLRRDLERAGVPLVLSPDSTRLAKTPWPPGGSRLRVSGPCPGRETAEAPSLRAPCGLQPLLIQTGERGHRGDGLARARRAEPERGGRFSGLQGALGVGRFP
ncbi:phosphatase domain-containing protein [Deinococcus planocerae]|uniref:phosphatase domain-containing protein n=1 Tax=Deinococcus planocerae TaxID=1737569 RepID=UPI0015E0A405|nr:App1 family protein [Deinococcus planocerae]